MKSMIGGAFAALMFFVFLFGTMAAIKLAFTVVNTLMSFGY